MLWFCFCFDLLFETSYLNQLSMCNLMSCFIALSIDFDENSLCLYGLSSNRAIYCDFLSFIEQFSFSPCSYFQKK
jgi:hypothetical protein